MRQVRRQPLRALVAAISVGAGVALAIALVVVTTSISTSVEQRSRALAGPTPLRVIGAVSRGGITPEAVAAITRTEGVAFAVPMVQAVTLVDTGEGDPSIALGFGIDCRVEQLVGRFGCSDDALAAAAAASAPPFVSASLAARLHGGAALRTDVGRIPLAGAATVPGLERLTAGNVVVFPMARAQQVFARGSAVDVVYVQPAAGVDVATLQHRLQTAVGPTDGVLGAGDPPPQVGILLAAFLPLFTLLTILGLGVGGVLVYNTVSLSVEERRRQLAIVGALGGTARVIVGTTLVEAATLGVVGGLLGAAGGALVARPITRSLSDFTQRVAGIPIHVHLSASTFAIGAALGLVLGVVAGWRPARRASRLDIAAELSNRDLRDEGSVQTTGARALLWTSIAVIGVGLCALAASRGGLEPWQASLAPIGFAITTAACTLLLAALAPLVVQIVGRRVASRTANRRLAVANLTRHPNRTGVMAVALGMAVSVAFITSSYTAAARQTITASLTRNLHGVSVSTLEPNNTANIDAKLSSDEVDRLGHLPVVARVDRAAVVVVGHEAGHLIGVAAFEDPWFNDDVVEGSIDRTRFDAGAVVIGPKLARDRGIRSGGLLDLDTPTGVVHVPVLAVVQNGDFGGDNVLMPYPMLERLYGPQPAQRVDVVAAPGVDDETLAREVRAAAIDPRLRVETARQLAADISASIDDQLQSFWTLQRGLLATAFVAVLSTLLLVGIQRRREVALLAAVGMRPSELARMVMTEAGIVGVVGVALGLVLSLVMYRAFLFIGPIVIGYREPFVLEPTSAMAFGVIALAVALAGALWPAWRTARIEVLTALQYE